MRDETAIRLYLDEHVWYGLAAALQQRGYDAIHVYDVDREGLGDEDQLAYAAEQGRALLTFNARDFGPLAVGWFFAGKTHAGIIISDQLAFGELLRRIERLLQTLPAEELRNTLRYLQAYQ